MAVVGLVTLSCGGVNADGLSFDPHVLVQVLAIEGVTELQCILRLCEVDEAVSHVDAFLEIVRQVEEVKKTFKSSTNHLLKEHSLRVLSWELPHHDCHHAVLPVVRIRCTLLPRITVRLVGSARAATAILLLLSQLLVELLPVRTRLWRGAGVGRGRLWMEHWQAHLLGRLLHGAAGARPHHHPFESRSHPLHGAVCGSHRSREGLRRVWVLANAVLVVRELLQLFSGHFDIWLRSFLILSLLVHHLNLHLLPGQELLLLHLMELLKLLLHR
mmetsp:Transcript_51077/g.119041  ORF Transcript_51077/g.119041 Transcript_51077/m.119041 type:complete len:272 (-) Transcript_51077:673-1488(-)